MIISTAVEIIHFYLDKSKLFKYRPSTFQCLRRAYFCEVLTPLRRKSDEQVLFSLGDGRCRRNHCSAGDGERGK